MTPSNRHPGTAAGGLRRTFLQAMSGLLTARARHRSADRVRARPRLEGLEDRCLLSDHRIPRSYRGCQSRHDHSGPRRQPLVHRVGQPTRSGRSTRRPTPSPSSPSLPPSMFPDLAGSRRAPTATSGSPRDVNQIGMINPTTHAITEFALPTAVPARRDHGGPRRQPLVHRAGDNDRDDQPGDPRHHRVRRPYRQCRSHGITAGPDGNLWFTESSANKIGEINPATHVIAEFAVPTANAWSLRDHGGPRRQPLVHRVTAPTRSVRSTRRPTPSPSSPSPPRMPIPMGSRAGPDGNLWFTDLSRQHRDDQPDDPRHHRVPHPLRQCHPNWITAGPDGNLWFTDAGTNAIGVVTLDQTSSTHLVITQQPPASMTAGSGFGLTVQAEDSSGNPVTSFNGTVTVGLASNPGGTTLGGTVTVAASGGVATFSGLTLTKAASGYTLYVSGSGPTRQPPAPSP